MTNACRLRTGIPSLIIGLLIGIGVATAQTGASKNADGVYLKLDTAFDAFEQGRYGDAQSIWQRLADEGVVSAQINLASLYDSGKGTAEDPAKAAALYRTAAAAGSPIAKYNLAMMHIEGRGVHRNLASAEELLSEAADQGMASAHFQLGLLYAGIDASGDPARMDLALEQMYAGGLQFDQDADKDGLEKTIAAMERMAPGDSRIDSLRARYKSLSKSQRVGTPRSADPSTSFGTAWPLENGYVVTNYHVVAGSSSLTLQHTDGRQVKARPVLFDQSNDLALLAVDDVAQLPPALPLCSLESPKGELVFTMGYPRVDVLGFFPKFSDGVISQHSDIRGDWSKYLTTVNIQPGNSGGPLLNKNGKVVGVVSAMLGVRDETTGEVRVLANQSCAIKVDNLHRLIGQLPRNDVRHHAIAGEGLPLQTLREKIKDSVLVVIARGENG